jgi:polyisoprenoid-binding protein YceI
MMRVPCVALLLIAFASLPAMAESSVPSPRHFTVVFEISQVRVLRVKIGAGDKTEPHEMHNAVAVPLTRSSSV